MGFGICDLGFEVWGWGLGWVFGHNLGLLGVIWGVVGFGFGVYGLSE